MNIKKNKEELLKEYTDYRAYFIVLLIGYVLLFFMMVLTNEDEVLNIFKLGILFVFGFMICGFFLILIGTKQELKELEEKEKEKEGEGEREEI